MTEQNLGEQGSQNQGIASPASTPAQPAAQQPVDRTFSQNEVNELIGRYKNEGYERGKREALNTQQSHSTPQPIPANQTQVQQPAQGYASTQQTPDELRRVAQEEAQKAIASQQYQSTLQQFANDFERKMQEGRQKHPDFADIERNMNLPGLAQSNPNFIIAVGQLDNAVEVFKELHGNPGKFLPLLQAASHPATFAYAQQQIKVLSDSIKQNDAAAKQKLPNEPLSQINPSVTGTDNGSMSIADYSSLYPG